MKHGDWMRPSWQLGARMAVDYGRDTFDPAYMLARGFSLDTCAAFEVGSGQTDRPFVLLPWYAPDGRLHALRYRYTDGQQPRYGQKSNSYNLLFGLQNVRPGLPTLVIEGELNAMSVWQVAHDWLNVVSWGSMVPEAMVRRYVEQTLCPVAYWTDGAPLLGAEADANDLLKAGKLAALLNEFRKLTK